MINKMSLSLCFSAASFGATASAELSILFDIGGIFGGIFAGSVSDYTGMSACTCSGMLLIAVPIVSSIKQGHRNHDNIYNMISMLCSSYCTKPTVLCPMRTT